MASVLHAAPSADAMLEAYQLKPPATAAKKKPKLRQPRDCSQTVAVAKKKAKARDAAAAKALGADPEAQQLQSLDERRTGLRNLGATCYMNSLIQQLRMMPGLAPQQETAVVPPGFLRFSLRTVSRSA